MCFNSPCARDPQWSTRALSELRDARRQLTSEPMLTSQHEYPALINARTRDFQRSTLLLLLLLPVN
jgi:hypothetical protein